MDTMTIPKALTDEEKKQLAEEFLKEVEARLEKEEKRTWMIRDHDHLKQYGS